MPRSVAWSGSWPVRSDSSQDYMEQCFNLNLGSPIGLMRKTKQFLELWSRPRVRSCSSIHTQPLTVGRVNGCQINTISLITLIPYSCVNHRHFASLLPLFQSASTKPRPLKYHLSPPSNWGRGVSRMEVFWIGITHTEWKRTISPWTLSIMESASSPWWNPVSKKNELCLASPGVYQPEAWDMRQIWTHYSPCDSQHRSE